MERGIDESEQYRREAEACGRSSRNENQPHAENHREDTTEAGVTKRSDTYEKIPCHRKKYRVLTQHG